MLCLYKISRMWCNETNNFVFKWALIKGLTDVLPADTCYDYS